MRLLTTLCLLLAAACLQAAPEDFARGVPVEPAADATAQRVPLPADVYRWVTRADLADIVVYDADGNLVPYALRRPLPGADHTPWQPLPLFPLPEPEPAADGAGVNIELGEGGAVVAVRGPAASRPGEIGYLLDASDYPGELMELKLSWPTGRADFVAKLRVDASDDLSRWRSLVEEATVAALRAPGEAIRLDSFEIPATRAAYLRLRQLDEGPPLRLDAAQARSRLAREAPRDWLTLTEPARSGPRKSGGVDGFEFQLPGLFPVDRVAAGLDAETFLLQTRLLARRKPDDPWRDLGTHRFYRARVDGRVAEPAPTDVSEPGYRYWRLEPSRTMEQSPRLRVGWQPDEVVLVSQGTPPYLLAYGQSGFQGRQWPVAELLQRLDDSRGGSRGEAEVEGAATLQALPLAAAGEPRMLGGPSRVEPQPQPVAWRTVILWLVLVAGVGLVALLAYRLVRGRSAA